MIVEEPAETPAINFFLGKKCEASPSAAADCYSDNNILHGTFIR